MNKGFPNRKPSRLLACTAGAVTFLLVMAAGVLAKPATQAASVDGKGLLLKAHSRLIGFYKILVCKQGIKLIIPSKQLTLIFAPPDWNARFMDTGRHIYSNTPASKWTAPMIRTAQMFRPGDPSDLVSVGSKPATLDGIACIKHTLKLPAGANSDGEHAWQKLLIREGELYCLHDPFFPKAVFAALARTVGSIQVDGIPLEMTCISNRNKVEEEVKLDSHSQVSVKTNEMTVPEDFKLVARPADVSNAGVSDQDFADFVH